MPLDGGVYASEPGMLKQASVSDLITDRVNREKGYLVITMRRYPRFVNRQLRDEYLNSMSPVPELHEDWLSAKRKYNDHNGAFARSKFEERFAISPEGLEHLARLSAMSHEKDVYLVCNCQVGYKCHRELVLMVAKKWFGADAERPRNSYPIFAERIRKKPKGLPGAVGAGLTTASRASRTAGSSIKSAGKL